MFRDAFVAARPCLWYALAPKSRHPIGQVFLVSPRVVVTAAHVVEKGGNGALRVGLRDGVWSTELAIYDLDADVAVAVLSQRLEEMSLNVGAPTSFPAVSDSPLCFGDSVALLGYLRRKDVETEKPVSQVIVTSGILSHWRKAGEQSVHWAVHGAFAEPGFSGGPVFTPDGRFVGVTSGNDLMYSQTALNAPMEFPLFAPLLPHREKIMEVVAASGQGAGVAS